MFLCLGAWFLSAGCQSRPIILSEIPAYRNARTDWKAGTACMIYPCFGSEEHVGVNTLCADLKTVLKENGYDIVEMEPYMCPISRGRVDKIIRPVQYMPRNVTNDVGKVVWDLMVIVTVEDRQTNLVDIDNREPLRFFQVWARDIRGIPSREAAEALLRVDGFREALEPREEPGGPAGEQPASQPTKGPDQHERRKGPWAGQRGYSSLAGLSGQDRDSVGRPQGALA
jgi:hypothetical protein